VYDDQNDQHPRGLRILVVDDNHDVTCSMSMLLELEGYQTGAV
jgi:CheY-like chemotaxis protein